MACLALMCTLHAGAKDVYGFMTGNSSDGEIPIGMYKMDTATMKSELLTSLMYQFWGGAYAGDKYMLILSDDAQGYLTEGLCKYDIDTKNLTLRYAQQPYQCADLTYDYSTATLYGIMNKSMGEDITPRLITINTTDGSYAKVAELKNKLTAVACTYFGDMYAMGADGTLYTLDKANGDLAAVGNTGIKAKTSEAQSMEFDRSTGELYWTGLDENDYTFFCRINPATGEVLEHKKPVNNALIAGLYIPFTVAESGAPAKPQNLTASIGDDGKVSLTWTNPATTYGGEALAGQLDKVEIWRGGTLVATLNGTNAGEEQHYTDDLGSTNSGKTRYVVYAYNSVGRGEGASTLVMAGEDAPAAVANLTAENGADGVRLTWTAPTTGKNGGSIKPENLSYTITRQPDGKELGTVTETSFTDNTIAATAYYTWSVVCKNATGESDAATTAATEAGTAVEPPYKADFETTLGKAQWLVQDNNADGSTWTAGMDGFTYNASFTNKADDNLLSVGMHLQKGMQYTVSYDIYAPSIGTTEHFRLSLLGNGGEQVIEDLDNFATEGFSDPETRTATFSVEADGDYHFCLSALSDADMFLIGIKAFSVLKENTSALQIKGVKTDADFDIMKAGESTALTVTTKNTGSTTIEKYALTLADKQGNVVETRTVEKALEPGAEDEQTINFTPTHKGDTTLVATVKTVDGDNSGEDSLELTYRAIASNETLHEMGGKDCSTDFPFWFGGYAYSYAQAIYTAEEVGKKPGKIVDMEYDYSNVGDALEGKHLKVYLLNTTSSDITKGWIDEEDMTLVVDTTLTLAHGDHTLLLHLKEPFAYTGNNLCVMTQNINGGLSESIAFYAQKTLLARTAIYNGDEPEVDFSKVQGAARLNYVRLTMSPDKETAVGGIADNGGLGIATMGNVIATSKAADITVTDISGKTVACKHNATMLDMGGKAAGIYIVKADANGVKAVKKVVVR